MADPIALDPRKTAFILVDMINAVVKGNGPPYNPAPGRVELIQNFQKLVAHCRSVGTPLIFVTTHRRESFGRDLERICLALKRIVAHNPDVWNSDGWAPNDPQEGPRHITFEIPDPTYDLISTDWGYIILSDVIEWMRRFSSRENAWHAIWKYCRQNQSASRMRYPHLLQPMMR